MSKSLTVPCRRSQGSFPTKTMNPHGFRAQGFRAYNNPVVSLKLQTLPKHSDVGSRGNPPTKEFSQGLCWEKAGAQAAVCLGSLRRDGVLDLGRHVRRFPEIRRLLPSRSDTDGYSVGKFGVRYSDIAG